MKEQATLILENKINELQNKIIQNKIQIADLFIKVKDVNIMASPKPNVISEMFRNMDLIDKHISILKKDEAKFETLKNSKTEIERAYLENCIK